MFACEPRDCFKGTIWLTDPWLSSRLTATRPTWPGFLRQVADGKKCCGSCHAINIKTFFFSKEKTFVSKPTLLLIARIRSKKLSVQINVAIVATFASVASVASVNSNCDVWNKKSKKFHQIQFSAKTFFPNSSQIRIFFGMVTKKCGARKKS